MLVHFTALNLFISKKKKGLKKVIRHLSTLRTWMLTLSFNILACVYLWIKVMKKLNDNLIKEEDFSQCYRSTQLKRRKSTGRDWRGFSQEKTTNSFDKYDTKHHCKYLHCRTWSSWQASLPFAMFFFSKTNERKMEASLSYSQCQVFQRLQHHVHWRVNTYSAISFEEIRFLHRGKFAFWLWKASVMSYSFCEPIKNHLFCTSFWSPKQEAMLVYNSIHPWARS